MSARFSSVEDYVGSILNPDYKNAIERLRRCILDHLPEGFSEELSFGMVGYIVPHTLYAPGYHCTPSLPLPFISIAAQKNFIALYHMGMYADPDLLSWFTEEWPDHSQSKLDMGKSCIRFKKAESIPYALIGQLVEKMTVNQWIELYEKQLKTSK